MLPEVSTLQLVGACALALVGGSFRGFAGFGSGLLMAPLLTLIVAPRIAVPILILLSFVASFYLVPTAFRKMEYRRVLSLGLPAAATIPLGAYLLDTLDADLVQNTISIVVLVMVAVLASGWRYPEKLGPGVTTPAGLVSGTLTGIGGVGGPPVILLLMSEPSPAKTTRANLIGFFAISQVVAMGSYVWRGQLDVPTSTLAATMAPFFLIPLWLGARFFRKSEDATYRRAALMVLGLVALVGLIL